MKLKLFMSLAIAGALYISCGSGGSDTETAGRAGSSAPATDTPASVEPMIPAVGNDAPLFTLPGTPDREDIVLAEMLQEKPVLLAFFPKAFTGG